MYRIYINEAVLIITDFIPEQLGNYQLIENQKFHFFTFYNDVKKNDHPATFVLLTEDAKHVFKQLKKSVTIIKAAGGLVRNEENKYLFIFRRGKWDLPKGKIDEGEKTKKAAVREVEEECGIRVDKVEGKLCKTWHVYEQQSHIILKKTTWYKMKAENQADLVPQTEEEITEAKWLALGDLEPVKQNTYPLIADLISFIEV
ncbi:NUDIX hydrolase [Rubrolithibacter danxiaensis]|uniref:NUDIX hydrolase n=1 Tax=Rubrolithibacter danxiaensis TaxID=3390805 RepID=UPI003BF8A852